MSLITATIVGTGQTIQLEIPTVRIPELPPGTLPFDPLDKIAFYDDSENKTVWSKLLEFRDYMLTGGNAAGVTPVLLGDDLEIVITNEMALAAQSSRRVSVPFLAGKTYKLIRRGAGPLTTAEWLNLPSGGFELAASVPLPEAGEVFFAEVYEVQAGQTQVSINNASLINGIFNATDSISLSDIHFKKLIHIAGNDNKVTVTLPDIADAAPLNLIVPIETNILNNFQSRIASKNGQSIYFNNSSQTSIYLGKSEYLWFLAGADGWYVLNASQSIFNVGQPLFDYKQRLNTLVAQGQLVNRADYPRLWEFAQSIGFSKVSDTLWLTETTISDALAGTRISYFPYKGCFSDGDGSTTFRLPDLREQVFRGLANINSTDAERDYNNAGGIQRDRIRKHAHDIAYGNNGSDGQANVQTIRKAANDTSEGQGTGTNSYAIQPYGGYETRMMNVGLLPLIRC